MFSNFIKSWYTAIGHVSTETNYVLPMLLLVMEVMTAENLGYNFVIVLHSVLEEQVIFLIDYQIIKERYLLGLDSEI